MLTWAKFQKHSNTKEKNTLLEVDATQVITHERTADISKSPIEDGSEITDHITLSNKKVSLQCVVSKNPFNFIRSSISSVLSGTVSHPIGSGIAASIGGILLRDNERLENAYLFINRLWENRIPFTVVAGLETYSEVVMTNLTITQTAQTKESIKFTTTLEQIKMANTDSSNIPTGVFDEETSKRASKIVNQGHQIPNEIDKEVSKKASSFLFKALQLTGVSN
ncbi:hypothetical protein MJH12_05045 [bacterium]|nr:hypothetical protein [bacterium]